MRQRKRRPQPLPTNQVEQFYSQPLGQEKGDSLSNLNCHLRLSFRKEPKRFQKWNTKPKMVPKLWFRTTFGSIKNIFGSIFLEPFQEVQKRISLLNLWNGSIKFEEPKKFFTEPRMALYHIFGTIGSVFHFWNLFGSLRTFESSPERRILESFFF